MREKWNDVCGKLDGKVSERGETLHCELPGVSLSFYPDIDRFLVSDHRLKTGSNIIDLWGIEHVQIAPDYIGVVSNNIDMRIRGHMHNT